MGDDTDRKTRPGRYWDHREARWLPSPERTPATVPPQAAARDDAPDLAVTPEGDVRSG
jgi:hypothetical protein